MKVTAIKALKAGDRVDLERDEVADPEGNSTLLRNEFQVVESVEVETDGCICVHFSDFVCAFPPDHEVLVEGVAVPDGGV